VRRGAEARYQLSRRADHPWLSPSGGGAVQLCDEPDVVVDPASDRAALNSGCLCRPAVCCACEESIDRDELRIGELRWSGLVGIGHKSLVPDWFQRVRGERFGPGRAELCIGGVLCKRGFEEFSRVLEVLEP